MTPRKLQAADLDALVQFMTQLTAESGRYGAPVYRPRGRDSAAPTERTVAALQQGHALAVTQPGWRRSWAVFHGDQLVAHVGLQGPAIESALHRAELDLGVLHQFRRRGLGRALLRGAIHWAEHEPHLDWLDLGVFENNEPAKQLYEHNAFRIIGRTPDRFRVAGRSLQELRMTRPLSGRARKIAGLASE